VPAILLTTVGLSPSVADIYSAQSQSVVNVLLHAAEVKLRAEWDNSAFDTSQPTVPALTVVILMLLIIISCYC